VDKVKYLFTFAQNDVLAIKRQRIFLVLCVCVIPLQNDILSAWKNLRLLASPKYIIYLKENRG